MGIILEKSKLIFDELVGTSSFDDVFKNSIRDYYTYGFKSYDQNIKGSQSVKDRWKIFSKILGEKWYFEKRKKGRNQIVLKTMPSGTDNPVDDFYFLHNLSKIGDYLNYLLDMDRRSTFNGETKDLPVSQDELYSVEGNAGTQNLENTNLVEYAIISNWIEKLQDKMDTENEPDGDTDDPIRLNRQLNIWSVHTRFMPASYKDKYANLSNRTEYLYSLGVIGDLRDNPEQRNKWLEKQWRAWRDKDSDGDNSVFKKYFSSEASEKANHFWYKSPLTMAMICDTEDSCLFTEKFLEMCEFFSQYYPLGEVGTILSERCSIKKGQTEKEIFRFKHNYVQKTLYDYNMIDILTAIENGYLCALQYSHGTNLKACEELIIPLEIRISVSNGREYVLYYHILERRIKALRLEFIDKITLYSHVDSMSKVKRTVTKTGKKKSVQEEKLFDIKIDETDLVKQVALANKMLPYIWGTDVHDCIVDEEWESRLISFEVPVSINSETEQFIKNRVIKERRIEKQDHIITIFPTKELRNWIRSFYLRVTKPEKIPVSLLDIDGDVNAMWNVYFNKRILNGDEGEEYKKNTDKKYIEESFSVNGDIVSETEGHGALFNELFSWYSIVLANSVLSIDGEHTVDCNLKEELNRVLDYYTDEEQEWVKNELYEYILESELVDGKGKVRFNVPKIDYLYDLLPITKIEVRWLLSVLDDPLARVFLSPEQINAVRKCLSCAPFKVEKLQIDAINYFDRYNIEGRISKGKKHIAQKGRVNEKDLFHIRALYRAIVNEQKVHIVYRNWEGKKRHATCAPVRIEYSRRDDVFRVWYVHVQNAESKIGIINIPRIVRVEELVGECFDLKEQRKILDKLYDKTMTSIQIEFYQGIKNLPDRILTEFSLWKKKCVYDPLSYKFTMILYYSALDEKEILIRLLSYGPYIRVIASEDNYILSEIQDRIKKQREIIRDREFEIG